MGRPELTTGTLASVEPDPYARAIAYATAEGTTAGENAAGWYVQDTIGGRVTGDPRPTARRILRGILDGDPAVLDTLPYADLSGEWTDTLTGPDLFNAALRAAGSDDSPAGVAIDALLRNGMTTFGDVCEAYELAFATAAEDAIATACKAVLA